MLNKKILSIYVLTLGIFLTFAVSNTSFAQNDSRGKKEKKIKVWDGNNNTGDIDKRNDDDRTAYKKKWFDKQREFDKDRDRNNDRDYDKDKRHENHDSRDWGREHERGWEKHKKHEKRHCD